MIRTHQAGTLRTEHVGTTVTLAGWVAKRRDLGGVAFLDLRDASGIVQVVVRDDILETSGAHALRNEYCIAVTGVVEERSADTVNPNLVTGQVEVAAGSLEVLKGIDLTIASGEFADDMGCNPMELMGTEYDEESGQPSFFSTRVGIRKA